MFHVHIKADKSILHFRINLKRIIRRLERFGTNIKICLMILSATFSKPSKNVNEILGRPYVKIRMKNSGNEIQAEFFTEKQAFQKNISLKEAEDFIKNHAGTTFKNAFVTTDTQEITYMANRHGEIKKLTRPCLKIKNTDAIQTKLFNRKKKYIIPEGTPVPFLEKLDVMTSEGKVLSKSYDKFRQINRFLEFIDDILPELTELCCGRGNSFTEERPLVISDFGCGKSYLTFAIYHFLCIQKNIPVKITGLDLKQDVIERCNLLAKELCWENIVFKTGDVCNARENYSTSPDLMITLHACDTATDYALEYAVNSGAKAILSVPCCQHEINLQLEKTKCKNESPFALLEKWGIIQERFSALATDAIRAELLEQCGYNVQMLEFIDMSHTPKNILIRAVKKTGKNVKTESPALTALLKELNADQKLYSLLKNSSRI